MDIGSPGLDGRDIVPVPVAVVVGVGDVRFARLVVGGRERPGGRIPYPREACGEEDRPDDVAIVYQGLHHQGRGGTVPSGHRIAVLDPPGRYLAPDGVELGAHRGCAGGGLGLGELRNHDRSEDPEHHHHDQDFDQGETGTSS